MLKPLSQFFLNLCIRKKNSKIKHRCFAISNESVFSKKMFRFGGTQSLNQESSHINDLFLSDPLWAVDLLVFIPNNSGLCMRSACFVLRNAPLFFKRSYCV